VTAFDGGRSVAQEQLARAFARAPRAKVVELLATLAALGHARRLDDGGYLLG
jgi:DNA-binding IclR family transcriptional regulator